MNKSLAISIVNYNSEKLVEKILKNLLASKLETKIEIWVVDNNSPDQLIELIKKEYKSVKLVENQENVGFGRAHNQVLKKINTDFVLILNPDTDFDVQIIDQMVDFMEEKNCAIASGKLVDYENNLQSNGGNFPLGLALIAWLFNLESVGLSLNFHRQSKEYYQSVREVDWLGGTFMMVKTETFKKIGYFDEKIFMYFEDTDFCYRAKRAGLKIMINPDVVIKHIGGGSSENPRLRQWTGEYKGLTYFYHKYFGVFGDIFIRLLIYISILLRMIAFTIIGKGEVAKTYGRVLFEI